MSRALQPSSPLARRHAMIMRKTPMTIMNTGLKASIDASGGGITQVMNKEESYSLVIHQS